MSHSIELVLPFSKAKVKITQPSWAARKTAMRKGSAADLDSEDIVLMMLSTCTEIDGKPFPADQGIAVFDSWSMGDVMHMIRKFEEWNSSGSVSPEAEKN